MNDRLLIDKLKSECNWKSERIKADASEIERLTTELAEVLNEIKAKCTYIKSMNTWIDEHAHRNNRNVEAVGALRSELAAKDLELSEARAMIAAKNAIIEGQRGCEMRFLEAEAEKQRVWDESMNVLQTEIGMWHDITFPAKTNSSIIEHLSREVVELKKANELLLNALDVPSEIEIFSERFHKLSIELADVCILSFGLAHHINVRLSDIVREKFEINKERKWGKPDESGVVEHVRVQPAPAVEEVKRTYHADESEGGAR